MLLMLCKFTLANIYTQFMKSLRTLRKEKGLTLKKMASLLTTDHPHVSRLESGLISPSQRTREWIEQMIFEGEKINWIDTPYLLTSPVYDTEWTETEREFRACVRMIKGLPEDQRKFFIKSSIKHLKKLLQT